VRERESARLRNRHRLSRICHAYKHMYIYTCIYTYIYVYIYSCTYMLVCIESEYVFVCVRVGVNRVGHVTRINEHGTTKCNREKVQEKERESEREKERAMPCV